MKYHHAVKKYFNNRVKNLKRILGFKAASYKPESFHKLRVEIKKIHAVFELINFCDKNFKKRKTYKPFKEVFKKAAPVREIQMEETWLRKYKIVYSNNSYAKERKDDLCKTKEKFHRAINKKLLHDLNNSSREASPAISTISEKDVNKYFKKTATEMDSLLKQRLKPEQLHELRKKLKIFYYTLKGTHINIEHLYLKKIDSFQEILGLWHDCRVAVRHISKSMNSRRMNAAEIKRWNKLKSKVDAESNMLVKKINTEKTKFLREAEKKISGNIILFQAAAENFIHIKI